MNEKLKVLIETFKINTKVYHADKFKPTIIVKSEIKSISIDIDEKGFPIVEYRLKECKDDDYSRSGIFHHEDLFLTPKEALNDRIKKFNKDNEMRVKDLLMKFTEMYN